jgi:hypothetical protein
MFPRERKKEERGSVAAEVCFSTALNGSFYKRGRGCELGFPEVAGAGKFSGRGSSVDDVRSRGWVVGDAAPPRACWRRSLTSATVSSRALWSGDREAERGSFSTVHGRGPARSSERSTVGRAGRSSGTPTHDRAYGGGVIYSGFHFSKNWITGVRRNA